LFAAKEIPLMRHLRQLAFPAVAAAALLAAGCGGGGDGTGGSNGSGGGSDTKSPSYKGGFEVCSEGTVAEIAEIYGVPEKTSDAVSTVIAEQLAGSSGAAEIAETKQGCEDAFAKGG
jgi:hypothetical protein